MGCLEGVASAFLPLAQKASSGLAASLFLLHDEKPRGLPDREQSVERSVEQRMMAACVEHAVRYGIPLDLFFGSCFICYSLLIAIVLFFKQVGGGGTGEHEGVFFPEEPI